MTALTDVVMWEPPHTFLWFFLRAGAPSKKPLPELKDA
jgi:hypothetical protein